MEKVSVSQHFVVAALGGWRRHRNDSQWLLREAGIPVEVLDNPKARVSGPQYTRLIQLLWRELEDEFMGFAEVRSKPGTFATMCYLIIHCNTLESVFQRAQTFYSLFEKPLYIRLLLEGDQASIVLQAEPVLFDPDHFLQESLLVIWHRLACWLIGQRVILDEVQFNYPEPGHSAEYRHLFNAPLSYSQSDTRLVFNRRFLQVPVLQDELSLKEFLKTSPADLLARPDDRNTYTARIRLIIGKEMNHTLPDFEFVASELNVSPQTLRRRLKDENTSYQEIKDQMRRDIALYHLARHDLAINEIAFKVGFTEPSTFHRAFKKWTGLTPGEYREGAHRDRGY